MAEKGIPRSLGAPSNTKTRDLFRPPQGVRTLLQATANACLLWIRSVHAFFGFKKSEGDVTKWDTKPDECFDIMSRIGLDHVHYILREQLTELYRLLFLVSPGADILDLCSQDDLLLARGRARRLEGPGTLAMSVFIHTRHW